MDLLLGLDVGTTATKALLINTKGEKIASASFGYGLITPREDWVEQDPEDFWRGVVTVCRSVMEKVKAQDRVLALSISSQGGTTIPVNADGKPVSNAFSWMDHRASEQADQVRKTVGADRIYEVSGWKLGGGLPLLHIMWLRQYRPEAFKSARYFLFVNDFIIHRLTGILCMDPSDAGITQLYNIAERRWEPDMLEIAGIEVDQLSPMQNSGYAVGRLTAKASQETGLPQSVLVVNGAHDQYCAAVGTGVFKRGDIMLSCGTAWAVLCFMEQLKLDPEQRLAVSPHAIPGKWGALKSMGGVGACMEWFLKNLWTSQSKNAPSRSEMYAELNRRVGDVPPGSEGLLFFSSSGGYERGARGAFIGLTLSHTSDHLARSVMEGLVFELRWTMEEIRAAGVEGSELRMVGGPASSPVWPKIVADIMNMPVVIPPVTEAASFGAAILAGVGSEVFSDPEAGYQALSGTGVSLEPNKENIERYTELFDIYQAISRQVQKPLSRLSDF